MKKVSLFIMIATLIFTACKKSKTEEPAPAAPTVVGLWKGKYSLTLNGALDQDVIYYIKTDGTIRVFNGVDTISALQKANGTWKLFPYVYGSSNIDAVFATYTYPSNLNTKFGIKFGVDKNFTKSNALNFDAWGIGDPLQVSSFLAKGLISIVKQ